MGTSPTDVVDPDRLNPTDVAILDELHSGRCTPAYIATEHDYTAGNVRNRMSILEDHGHVNGLGGGLYELVDDPRGEASQDAPQEGSDVEGQARIDTLEARADGLRADNERLREHSGIDADDLRPILAALEGANEVSDRDEVIERLRALIEGQ